MDLNEARRQKIISLIDAHCRGNKAEFARRIGVQASYLHRMLREPDDTRERKAIGEEMASKIELAFDLQPGELLLAGVPLPDSLDRGRSDEPPLGVDQLLSRINPLNTPQSLTVEQLMEGARTNALPGVFTLTVWDESMGDIERGGTATLRTGIKPVPGKPVLVQDRAGNLYLRDYKPKTPTIWTAQPRNPAWGSLDSEADGLRILAVMTGFDWFKARE